ncbi:MAG: response regulator [Adhaeribacter sp.]
MSLQVILVDDDDMVMYLHKMLARLSGLAANPVCFGDGKSTLAYLTAHHQADSQYLVLLDINMPEMNGWDFLQAVQHTRFADALLVIMVTSSIDEADREKAREFRQVVTFLEKPLNVETCRQILHLPELKARMENNTNFQSPSL